MVNSRLDAVIKAFEQKPVKAEPPSFATSHYFGCLVFNRINMRRYLSADVRKSVYDCIDERKTLDRESAEEVAAGMKKWAIDMGVTHYTHWFQPLNGGTAEKHDSFAVPYRKGEVIEEFTGKELCQQEPDASSFPSGGLRNTFEARGYTAWDPSSPAFIIDDCLCIPTVFVSYNGDALDFKTPLLKSSQAVAKAAEDVLEYFGIKDDPAQPYLGWEQEYFLVDSGLYAQRPDLVMAERTLVGHNSARNQQLDDHYFGSIPSRALEFMKDLEFEQYKLGIPLKTRHNEVAPNQFEIAPVYETANLANDHNLLLMSIMRKVAERHGFKVLFHEKPYAGVNGSGKHCNWSIGTESGIGLLSPGKTDEENLRFLCFMANTLKAVYDYNALLKASVMSATNSCRLGANEAPPQIISSFLGSQVSSVFDELLKSKDMVKIKGKRGYSLGIPQVPELLLDNTDRNRTSPFAFTGNRFEFRAVGSSMNCSSPVAIINTAVAAQLVKFKKAVDKRIKAGAKPLQAVLDETRDTYRACKAICFDGNGYSDTWKDEAAKRGLDCEMSPPLCFDEFVSKKTIDLFKSVGVLNEVELTARAEICWEIYCKKIDIEVRILADLTENHILPVAMRYQDALLDAVSKMKEVFSPAEYKKISEQEIQTIRDIADHMNSVRKLIIDMEKAADKAIAKESERDKAIYYHDKVLPYLDKVRVHVDALEMIVDDEIWPLPKYRELLFIH